MGRADATFLCLPVLWIIIPAFNLTKSDRSFFLGVLLVSYRFSLFYLCSNDSSRYKYFSSAFQTF